MNQNILLLFSLDFEHLRQLKKLKYTEASANDMIDRHWPNLAPIPQTLHLKIFCQSGKVRRCLARLEQLKQLQSLCLQFSSDSNIKTTIIFSSTQEYLPELRKLEINFEHVRARSFATEPILNYLRSANHLMELSLLFISSRDIELNDFYERVLEIIEKRQDKLPLKVYHKGQTTVRNNNLLKILKYIETPFDAKPAHFELEFV